MERASSENFLVYGSSISLTRRSTSSRLIWIQSCDF
jgi:hypothetical protein